MEGMKALGDNLPDVRARAISKAGRLAFLADRKLLRGIAIAIFSIKHRC